MLNLVIYIIYNSVLYIITIYITCILLRSWSEILLTLCVVIGQKEQKKFTEVFYWTSISRAACVDVYGCVSIRQYNNNIT